MPRKDTPPISGLTRNPHETGIVHDVYSTEGNTWYLTKRELVAVNRRAARRGMDMPVEDLDDIRDRMRTRKRQNRGPMMVGRKVG